MRSEDRIRRLEAELQQLPQGSVSCKTINGKERLYLQGTENGKRFCRYVKQSDMADVLTAVARREALRQELAQLMKAAPHSADAAEYETNVITGSALNAMTERVRELQRRDGYDVIRRYLNDKTEGRVCVLCGLRRTGKTVLALQAASDLPTEKTAYIKVMQTDTLAALNRDMKRLVHADYRYVIIDEVTLLKDFIDSASLFSDIYAMQGVKIILSGTDSLGFLFAEDDELYDRTVTVRTTFIAFREYRRLLGNVSFDDYLTCCGTFLAGETAFDDPTLIDERSAFSDDETARRYIDTAVARNIQHSLACYQAGSHFRHLRALYEAGELTNAVNRLVEDLNHDFLVSVIERDFASHDLGVTRRNLRKERNPSLRTDVLDTIDVKAVTKGLKRLLDIRNRSETTVPVTETHLSELKDYLFLLDLIIDCPTETLPAETPVNHILFTQPGLRYCQAQALVHELMKDAVFAALPARERARIKERLLTEVRGRLMEEIVLLETVKALPRGQRAFKLQFAVGEFDMVIANETTNTCRIFEVKHSTECVPSQYRHLKDAAKCAATEHRFGPITEKCVIYRGPDTETDGIRYRNVENYLTALGR